MPTIRQIVGKDATTLLTEYSSDFDQAYVNGAQGDWSNELGLRVETEALILRHPIPYGDAGYHEFTGDDEWRRLDYRVIECSTKLWQDGVEADRRKIEAGDFISWRTQPEQMAEAALLHPNRMVADALEANPFTDLYTERGDGGTVVTPSARRLFANNHPFNIAKPAKGTFNNIIEFSAFTQAWAKAVAQHFTNIKAPNGRNLGLLWTHLGIPATMIEEAKDFFSNDIIIQEIRNVAGAEIVGGAPVKNRFAGAISLVVMPELTKTTDIYPAAMNKGGATPWPFITQVRGTPQEIRFDVDSEYCRRTNNVQIGYRLDMAASVAMPHAIALCSRA